MLLSVELVLKTKELKAQIDFALGALLEKYVNETGALPEIEIEYGVQHHKQDKISINCQSRVKVRIEA